MSTITSEVFINAIGLLIKNHDSKSQDLVDELLEFYYEDTKTNKNTDDVLNNKFIQLLETLKRLPNDENGKVEKGSLLVKFLTDPQLKQDTILYSAIRDTFEAAEKNGNESFVEDTQRKLTQTILWNKFNKYVKHMWNKLSACNTTTDLDKQELYLNDAINFARKVIDCTSGSERLKKGAVERVDFSDKDSIKQSLSLYKEREVTNVMRTGLQGLNRMLGKRKGFALGESVCIYALLHNFKSGLLMTIARGLVCYNIPASTFTKPPVVLFISLENEANRNVMWLYRTAYENLTMASSEGTSDTEIVEFIHDYYNKTGYKLFIERWPGNKFGYDEYVELIESYEAQGYIVVATVVDYANKMKKISRFKTETKREDLQITELFENICTYTKTKGIIFITAHQLNREAMKQLLTGKNNAVKSFSAAFAGGSIGASQEIDLELFVHLEMNQYGQKYLTIQRGKHRYVDDTPESHKYCAYQFTDYGIGDDITGEPQYVSDIYAVDAPENYEMTEDQTGIF